MATWARSVAFRVVVLFVSALTVTTACSNMFSQLEEETGEVVFEFQASLLLNEQGASSTPYLIPTADRIEATLSRGGDTDNAVATIEQGLERTPDGSGLVTVLEFASVATNVEYIVSVRLFSSDNPELTLHSGETTVSPLIRAERNEEVALRLNAEVVEDAFIEADGNDVSVVMPSGNFLLYKLNTPPDSEHVLSIDGDYEAIDYSILSSSFHLTGIPLDDDGNALTANLPQANDVYYLALYNPADEALANIEVSVTPVVPSEEPPTAPTDVVVEFTAENTFNLYWTDTSNNEEGFRIYEDDGMGSRVQLGADIAAGVESLTNQSSSFATPVDDYTIEVVAFNPFGESDPLSFTFRLLEAAQFPSFSNSVNSNDPTWVAAGNPGSVGWTTMIVGGGSAVNVYVDTADISDPNALPAPTVPLGPPFELSSIGPFTPGATYNWRVETVGDVGNEGRVIYPVNQFAVRDGIYVDSGGTVGGAGSITEPLASVVEAVAISEPGETIRVTQGLYDQGLLTILHDLTIEGSYETTAYTTRTANATTILTDIAQQTYAVATNGLVVLDRIEARAPDSAGGPVAVRFEGGDLSLVDSRVVIADGVTAGPGVAMGLVVAGTTGSIDVSNTEFSLGGVIDGEARGIWLTNGSVNLTVSNTNFTTGNLTATHLNLLSITASPGTRIVEVTGSTFGGSVTGSTNASSSLLVEGDALSTSIVFSGNTINPIDNEDESLFGVFLQGAVGPTSIQGNTIDMMKPGQGNVYAVSLTGIGGQTPRIEGNRIQVPARETLGTSYGVEVPGDSGADIVNNVIELGGMNASLASYGILTTSPGTRVVNNTIVVGENYGAGAATNLIWFQPGSTGIVHNNILWSRPPALHAGVQNDVALDLNVTANIFFGTSDDVIALNATNDNFAGNFEIDPDLMTVPTFPDADWYKPNIPLETGAPAAVRSLVLAGGVDDHRGAGGVAQVDINGDPRDTGPVSIGAYQVSDTTAIGAVGPAGGLVFYENPDYRNAGETWRFMEVAAVDYGLPGIAIAPWWPDNTYIDVPGTQAVIGTGIENTSLITTELGGVATVETAAQAAATYDSGSMDWFLPSLDELSEVYTNLHVNDLGGFSPGEYWSSTQSDLENARTIEFGSGSPITRDKTLNYRVRPVRRF
ncbi:MAG: hypothetical protein ACLFNQ_12610 [Spirochaetaceae bacterium]